MTVDAVAQSVRASVPAHGGNARQAVVPGFVGVFNDSIRAVRVLPGYRLVGHNETRFGARVTSDAGVKTGGMPKVFSRETLEKFEDASASIVLRRIDHAFAGAGIALSADVDETGGNRRAQFRRYVASVDQRDPQHVARLGVALGALVEAVAESKEAYLVRAAEHDGFILADGVFRAAEGMVRRSFAIARVEEFSSLDERGGQLHRLADEHPGDAVAGAMELLESVCRTALRRIGSPNSREAADLVAIADSTVVALALVPPGFEDEHADAVVRTGLRQLSMVVAHLGALRDVGDDRTTDGGGRRGLASRDARLAIGAAVTFARFVAEAYAERAASSSA